jgi:hypothetical protein
MSICELQWTISRQAEQNVEVLETQRVTPIDSLFPNLNIIQLERSAYRPAGVNACLQFSTLDDHDTVNQDILDAFRIFGGLLVC